MKCQNKKRFKCREFEDSIIDLFKKYDVKIEAYYEPSYCENEFCDAAHPEYILKPKKFREVRMTSIYREFEEK